MTIKYKPSPQKVSGYVECNRVIEEWIVQYNQWKDDLKCPCGNEEFLSQEVLIDADYDHSENRMENETAEIFICTQCGLLFMFPIPRPNIYW